MPLARRAFRLEVPERVLASGEVSQPLDREAVRHAVRHLKEAGLEAVAVCFLYSYLTPEHEDEVAEIVAEEFPEAYLRPLQRRAGRVPRVRASLDHCGQQLYRADYERVHPAIAQAFAR